MSDEKAMGQVIRIDEARIRDHLGEMVRGTVEETLNAMLDAEADQLCGAGRYERSEARQDTRAGSYERTLQTSAGEVSLKVPKLRRQTFETAIIERYRRRESSVEEALIEMYLAGISVRRVEDITEALWGTRVSPSTVSNLNKKIYAPTNRICLLAPSQMPRILAKSFRVDRTGHQERDIANLAGPAALHHDCRRDKDMDAHLRSAGSAKPRSWRVSATPGRSRPHGRAADHF